MVLRKQIENFLRLWLACQDHPSVPHSLHQITAPASLAPVSLPIKVKAAIANDSLHTWREWT